MPSKRGVGCSHDFRESFKRYLPTYIIDLLSVYKRAVWGRLKAQVCVFLVNTLSFLHQWSLSILSYLLASRVNTKEAKDRGQEALSSRPLLDRVATRKIPSQHNSKRRSFEYFRQSFDFIWASTVIFLLGRIFLQVFLFEVFLESLWICNDSTINLYRTINSFLPFTSSFCE